MASRIWWIVPALVIAAMDRAVSGVSFGEIPVSATVAPSCVLQIAEAVPFQVDCVRGTHVVLETDSFPNQGRTLIAQAGEISQLPLGDKAVPTVVTVYF